MPTARPIFPAILLAAASILPAADAVEIVDAETLRSQIVILDGVPTLRLEGQEWVLLTDPRDKRISQLGDGAFHPMDRAEVLRAIRAVRQGRRLPDARIYILPFPRRDVLKSSCHGNAIFLSPGIRNVPKPHVHATVVHELGHVLQHQHLSDNNRRWAEYLTLRGLAGVPKYHERAAHRDRPAEIFAEDFRYLFGGQVATSSGRIENPNLTMPDQVPGLEEFLRDVLRSPRGASAERLNDRPRSYPNPFRASEDGRLAVRFQRTTAALHSGANARIYDLAGRLVREVSRAALDADNVTFHWNGRDHAGRRVASGVYLVRWVQRPDLGTARVQVLH